MSRMWNMALALAVVTCLACSGGSNSNGNGTSDPGGSEDPGQDTPAAACPAEPPIGKKCTGSGTCEFGQECCCGDCHPSLVCTCTGEFWGCWYTDACLGPCP